MKIFTPIVAALAFVSLLDGRQLERSCGTYNNNWREELELHRRSLAGQPRAKLLAGKQAVRLLPDLGNIAHLEDTDGVVARRNPYNLNGLSIRFVPSAGSKSYRVETSGGSFDSAAAESGTLVAGLGDDDSREITLRFPFAFFGGEYRSFHLNSDGNLTFGKADADITDRSLGRMLSGPPRIAAQFNDLDPSRSNRGVKLQNEANRVVISWDNVPEYSGTGRGANQRFQIRLFRDGVIEFAYATGSPSEAVTGITPGGLKGDPSLVTFASGVTGEYSSTVAERFTNSESIDIFSAAQKFFRNHDDNYDYLAIYNTMNIDAGPTAVAYEVTVRNNRSGYGDPPSDVGEQAGSKKRLQAILNMGPLSQYPADPNATVSARLGIGDTPLSTIAHEMGHLFLAYAAVDDETGGNPLLGYQSAHWDFKFNSDASLLEGNRIQDNGAGASPRFLTTGAVEGYSALDQYLMGLRAPEEVPDSFYVKNTRGANTTGPPRTGVGFDGTRVDVSLREIIGVTGRRTPDHTVSQRQFKVAFLIVTPEGQTPTTEQLAQVEAYRAGLQAYFEKATGGRASVDTVLRKSLSVSAFPAFGVLAGGKAPVSVTVERPVAAPLTVALRSVSGRLTTPSLVTIPTGATEARFEVTGVSAGADDLVFTPANEQYDAVTSKVQVAHRANLKLNVLSDASPVRLQVTDSNDLPYPGVMVEATASPGGSIDRAASVTGLDGVAEFRWTQSADNQNTLVASIPGGVAARVTAAAAPAFAATGVVNAASYAPGLVAGGIATVFGSNLGGENARVTVNGRPAEVLFANAGQLNFVAPADLADGTAQVVVRSGNAISSTTSVPVRRAQPGIFFNTSTNYGAITKAGSGLLSTEDPPARGEFIAIYATGLGAVRPGASGLEETLLQPEVLIGGNRAEVTYSGLAPGFVGLYQVNARIPSQIPAGDATVVLATPGFNSNEVRIRIRQ